MFPLRRSENVAGELSALRALFDEVKGRGAAERFPHFGELRS